jgi:hypothetical protein
MLTVTELIVVGGLGTKQPKQEEVLMVVSVIV